MTEKELNHYLQQYYPKESTSCEWKEFKNLKHFVKGHEGEDIISYVSAIANMEGGHLIIGVKDETLEITGIKEFYNNTPENIVLKILGQTPNLSSEGFYVEPFTTSDTDKTVWVFHIPKHQPRKPVLAHNKPWQRVENSLVRMRPEREQAILNEPLFNIDDWSAEICPEASIADLSDEAIAKAREKFKERNSRSPYYVEIDNWDNAKFLDKSKITIRGKITNTAILLLGKEESSHFFLPSIAEITWKLETEEKAYEHFGTPLLINTSKVLKNIRNVKYKFFPDNELLATTVNKYDTRTILEALHNCIAHQDYSLNSRIIVTEKIDKLIFSNAGNFFEGNPLEYSSGDKTPERYRNTWLANAMVNLGMIDRLGYGIHTMYLSQKNRYFPLPDYELSEPQKVVLHIHGHTIDENYSKLLIEKKDLPLSYVVLLDRIQKKLPVTDEAIKILKQSKLIEGRKPNYFIAAQFATTTDDKVTYIRNRAFDDAHYKEMILSYLKKFGEGNRSELENLIIPKLSEVLKEKQKKDKVKNLLQAMRKDNLIRLKERNWILV